MIRPQFANNEIYHIYNRGVEKREVFLEESDRFRFIHDLFEFNDEAPAIHYYYKKKINQSQCPEVEPRDIGIFRIYQKEIERKPRKLLVEILVWCLMPNHYHLLLRQIKDNGIVRFMQKLGTGYTMYFNQKYERNGVLFQGRFKAVLIKNENHFMHLPFYIHGNPLDLIEPGWREGKLNNFQKAIKFLESYRQSSHLDYIGKKNFPSVSQRDFLLDIFEGEENYETKFQNWLKEMGKEKLEELDRVILERT